MDCSQFVIDYQSICWNTAFVLGVGLFFYGIIYIVINKGAKEEQFFKAGAFEFIAGWIMYIPEELFNDIPDSTPGLHAAESVFTALIRTINMSWGNGYERVSIENQAIFSSIYSTVRIIVNIALLLFIAGLIIKFLDGPFQLIKISFRKRRYTYLFPACNEKTISIASSVEKKKCNIIFCCDTKSMGSDFKHSIDLIDGIYIDQSLKNILHIVLMKTSGIEIFLFGVKEEYNLSELEDLCKNIDLSIKASVKVYVELCDTPWSLYDRFLKEHNSGSGERLIVNFVRTEENFVYNNLLKNSIFENANLSSSQKYKEIKFLLIGMNERNMEMVKTLLHLGQMPGYKLSLMIIDQGSSKALLKERLPEVHSECNKEGDAIYEIKYYEDVDLNSDSLISIVKDEYSDFTFAFVNTENDLLNANISMRLNAFCFRISSKNTYKIQCNMKNYDVCKDWNSELTKNIDFVGDVASTYAYNFITMSDIERGTIAIHNVRYSEGTDRYRSWVSYCNNEYNRHSVYARTLSLKYKVQIIHDLYDPDDKLKGTDREWDIYKITWTDKIWKIYEHMRWNMYTRSMGFVLADKSNLDANGMLSNSVRSIAKVHNDLVEFSKLSVEEQEKDALVLTPEIVKILRTI